MVLSVKKITSIFFLVAIVCICLFLQNSTCVIKESFSASSQANAYSIQLLNTLGPIVFAKNQTSADKITAIQALQPPIADTTVTSILGNAVGVDAQITQIQQYLASNPSGPSPTPPAINT